MTALLEAQLLKDLILFSSYFIFSLLLALTGSHFYDFIQTLGNASFEFLIVSNNIQFCLFKRRIRSGNQYCLHAAPAIDQPGAVFAVDVSICQSTRN